MTLGARWAAAAVALALWTPPPEPVPARFRNVAAGAGVDFVLENGATPEKQIPETMAGGVAAFDYDGDGLADLFFSNGAAMPSLEKSAAKFRNRLYRNLGGMKFRDVTEAAGLAGQGFSMGAAAADYDNDGDIDLFVAGVRGNQLYRNDRGRFTEVAHEAGIRGGIWAITGGWLDYDNDGRLDLLVVNYLDWDPRKAPSCGDPPEILAYCHPKLFAGLPNVLYRNRGDGTFEDVSARAGISKHVGKGMSVAFADYDLDGDTDIFVTNDKIPSFLFRNDGKGGFEEVGAEAGVALPDHGRGVSAMGADFRDYDNDGRPDIAYAALAGELFPLFRNETPGWFRDFSYRSRLGPLAIPRSGWSPGLFDLNNDGWKDLFVSGAHVNDTVEQFEATQYKLPNSVFLNAAGTFRDGSAAAGEAFQVPAAHRGSAFADFNQDGRIDVAVSVIGGPAELWENITEGGNWLLVRLEGRLSNRDGIGARVRAGAQWNSMSSSVGYASSSHAGVHFGLGAATETDVEVFWPGGRRQLLPKVKANQILTVAEPVR